VTLEELDAELALEAPDLRGQPGLRDPEPLGGAREAALLGDRDEIPQVTEVHGRPRTLRPLIRARITGTDSPAPIDSVQFTVVATAP